jgi:hypothetical protein
MTGIETEVKWHREGEDKVEFYIPHEFVIVLKTSMQFKSNTNILQLNGFKR